MIEAPLIVKRKPRYRGLWWNVSVFFHRLWDRLETFYICFFRFFHRVWRYKTVLAYDYDFDWTPMAEFMELKLKAMAECLDAHRHVRDEAMARECRVSAELCRRLRTDAAFEMHDHMERGPLWASRISASDKEWLRYLGVLIGKHMTWWWT